MKADKECINSVECIIDVLTRRKNELTGTAWTILLSVGQDLCDKPPEAKLKARQSFEQAGELADGLIEANDKDGKRIKASAETCIGAISLCQNKPAVAIGRFMQGQALFEIDGDQYGEAVALFGLAQSYKAQGKWDKVFQTYEKCQRVLSRVNSDPATVYLRQLVKERYIEAISEERKKTQATTSTVIVGTKSFSIGILPVFSQIPAGDPRSIPETETGYIETDRFIVNGKTYYVAESRSTRFRLDFSVQWTYIASRVQGDSMNKAGIDDEDYVILRIPATAGLPIIPENGDIVAVALPEDDGVTLKRYRRRGDQVIFEPDSTNPNHQSYPFKSSKESEIPAKIIGIHVATLKPL